MIDATKIKLVCVDLDGTLTNGDFQISSDGTITKSFNTKDFCGLQILQEAGVDVLILTGSTDDVIDHKMRTLPDFCKTRLTFQKGINEKANWLSLFLSQKNLSWEQVAYMGDGENDYAVMKYCAITACPSDALTIIKKEANFISTEPGGKGAVNQFVTWLLELRANQQNGN